MSDNFKSAEKPKSETENGWIEYAILKFWRDCLSRDEHIAEKADAELETLRRQIAEAVEGLKFIADFGSYATDGNIETSDGLMHVSEYAADVLKNVTPA